MTPVAAIQFGNILELPGLLVISLCVIFAVLRRSPPDENAQTIFDIFANTRRAPFNNVRSLFFWVRSENLTIRKTFGVRKSYRGESLSYISILNSVVNLNNNFLSQEGLK
jgi:hypothetical protein